MESWVLLGALIGALAGAGLWAARWRSHFAAVLFTMVGGCILGMLAVAVAVLWWNTLVLPALVLRRTTGPLAKAALGLGLLFNGILLYLPNGVLGMFGYRKLLSPIPIPFETMGTLLAVLGPILCLEIAAKARSRGSSSGPSSSKSARWSSGWTPRK
jgi:hypothetical protein